jgi:RNA polymerase sigma-70 factor (ECF subfamily)
MSRNFDEIVLPHLDAGYRLARWIMRNEHDAEDVVQEASLRALRYFRTFVGGDGRAWFLRIVRNTCHSWHGHNKHDPVDEFDEEQHSDGRPVFDPETLLLRTDHMRLINRALATLPDRLREVLVLRELEELSYSEIAEVMSVPIGTVMSRLSRARQAFRTRLQNHMNEQAASLASHTPRPEVASFC